MNNFLNFIKNIYFLLILLIFLNVFFVRVTLLHADLPPELGTLSESDMQNPTILTNQGWKYLDEGKYDKANEFFQKALKIDKYQANAYVGLGKLVMERNHRPFQDYDKDSCKKALPFFDIAISIDERTGLAHANKSFALICMEDFDAALLEADVVAKYTSCYVHSLKAKAYKGRFLKKKDPSDKKMAIIEATDYMECDDSGIKLFRDVMRTMQDFESTEKYLKHNVELKPYQMLSYYYYYQLLLLRTDEGYMKDTDISEVERVIRECKAKTNFDIGALFELHDHRGEYFFKTMEYERALVEYTESLAELPNNTIAKQRMSFLCSQFTDDHCIKSWQKIIKASLERVDCVSANEVFKTQYANHSAAFEQMKEAVSQCKEKKVSAKESKDKGVPRSDEFTKIKKLLESNPKLKLTNDEDSVKQLHSAAYSGRIDIVKLLIERGIDVNAKIKNGKTFLHAAAWGGQLEVARYLIEKGANIKAKDENDLTPLHIAVFGKQLEVVRLFIGKGADVNAKDENGETPLKHAASSGRLEIVKFLVEKGSDVNAKNNVGWTPLHSAVSYSQPELVIFLIEKGADVNAKDDDGATPLHLATINKKDEMINLLKKYGGIE